MILFFDIFLSKLDTFRVGALIQCRLLGLNEVLNISLMLYIHFSVYKQIVSFELKLCEWKVLLNKSGTGTVLECLSSGLVRVERGRS